MTDVRAPETVFNRGLRVLARPQVARVAAAQMFQLVQGVQVRLVEA